MKTLAGFAAMAALVALASGCSLWRPADPHVSPVGFFDLHVCNWPDRPLFFKAVFSSIRFEQLQSVDVFRPDGKPLLSFQLDQFRTVRKPGKPVKRVHLVDIPVPVDATDGWYTARIRTRDGREYVARDHIELRRLGMVAGATEPVNLATTTSIPRELRWTPVPGASYYVAFVYDLWNNNKVIFESPRVTVPRVVLPPGVLEPGGAYEWRVNARDRFEDHEYGDFNHGSLSEEFRFNTPD